MRLAQLMPHGILVLATFMFLSPSPIVGLRVLGLFPHPGVSHFHFFKPIMQVLAAHGHNVTVVSHFPDPNPPPNYKDLTLTGLDMMHNSVDLDVSSFHIVFQL